MRFLLMLALTLSLFLGGLPQQVRAEPVSIESLLREMIDRDRITRWPSPEYVSKQASSYDRRSRTPDDPDGWFANTDWSQFIRSEVRGVRREWVMMDAEGPGCITRIWWGGVMPPKSGRVRFYFDGSDTPGIEAPAYALLVGPALVGRPLAIENAQGNSGAPGGMNLFLPIPFAHHCKITWDDVNPHDAAAPPESRWYNIEHRSYAAGTPVITYTAAGLERARSTVSTIQQALAAPEDVHSGKVSTLDRPLYPGSEDSVDLPEGPAAARLVEIQIVPKDTGGLAQALRSTIVRMTVDGEETVWCPVGDFFGSGVGLNPLQSWYRTVSKDGRMVCRWIMPYRKKARLTVQNLGAQPIVAHLRVLTDTYAWDDRSLHFRANWRCQYDLPTRPFSDWNYISVDGQGIYMGDTLTVYNPVSDWWGEGDEKIWIDNETFPSHFGTGSEDYYGYSWGDTHLFQGPFSSQVRCDGPGNKGYTVVTRTRNLDAIPFKTSLQFDMEIWHWADCKETYAVATYWYGRPGATHNRGRQHSEAIHHISM